MQKKIVTSYEISATGAICQIDRTQIIDDDGSVLTSGDPHRTQHMPVMRRENKDGSISVIANDRAAMSPGAKALAGAIWTGAMTSAAIAAETQRILAETEAAKTAQKRTAKTQ